MKIAIIRQRYNPFGGAERFVERAMKALGGQAQLSIVTRKWPGGEYQAIECNPFYLGSLWRDWGFARCVCAALQKQQFDLVQSHERLNCCDIYRAGDGVHAEWLAQRGRTQSMLQRWLTRLNPYHRYVLAAERRMFEGPRLKAVICNSHMVKQEIRSYFGLAEEKLHVIYSGIDAAEYHPGLRDQFRLAVRQKLEAQEDTPVFLYVGSGYARKGLEFALRALVAVPAAHLWVVGKDKHAVRYAGLAQRLGVVQRVRFMGGQSDVKPYYAAADALVLPTLYDPFPNVALEAMACALPVISSDKSGAAELIRDGENGYVCDAMDVSAIAAHMLHLCDPAVRQRLGAAARETVLPLSPAAMAGNMGELYRKVLAASAAGSL